jgi:hypothetical protein
MSFVATCLRNPSRALPSSGGRLGPDSSVTIMFTVNRFLPMLALAAFALLPACEEKRVNTNSAPGSYTGMRPAPTRVEPSRVEMRRERKKDNPLEEVGEDLGDLFDGGDKKSKKQTGLRIASPAGNSVNLPRNYTGHTNFQDADGRKYRLRYERGTLVGIEPQNFDTPKAPAEAPTPAAESGGNNE